MANYFESDVIFLGRNSSKTPDLYVIKTNLRWELKSPIGGGKYTIRNNLREAEKQSKNVVLDLSRSKSSDRQGISRAKEFIREGHSQIRRLLVVTKTGDAVDIKTK
ncbi:hypothetical protein IJH02_01270 [Candidatus Saccharibacteria bacterium]|nr:hypothetical protein [Candidatus Saccharibacteria bacterium]